MILMKLYLFPISYFRLISELDFPLLYSYLFLNHYASCLVVSRRETPQLSSLLVVLQYYKFLILLRLVFLFSSEGYDDSNHVGMSLYPSMRKIGILSWVECNFSIINPGSIALLSSAKDILNLWGFVTFTVRKRLRDW